MVFSLSSRVDEALEYVNPDGINITPEGSFPTAKVQISKFALVRAFHTKVRKLSTQSKASRAD